MIFQTENQLNELGDKLPGSKKSELESALSKLKDAKSAGDIKAIDESIQNINNVWQAASQQMYENASSATSSAEQHNAQ